MMAEKDSADVQGSFLPSVLPILIGQNFNLWIPFYCLTNNH